MNEIKKLSNEDYFASSGLSNSYLLKFDRAPAFAEMQKEPTEAMENGTLVHDFILDENFNEKYIFSGITDKRKKEYKELVELEPNKIILSRDDTEKINQIKENLLNYELFEGLKFRDILNQEETQKEIALFWEIEIDGIIIQKKAKLDILFQGENPIIIDLKKTQDCLDFFYSVKKYKYYRQAFWYSEGVKELLKIEPIFIFLTFEFDEPFPCKAYILDENFLHKGNVESLASVLKWMEYQSNPIKNKLYKNGLHLIECPKYFYEN